MTTLNFRKDGGRGAVNWSVVTFVTLAVHLLVIGGVEVFWKLFTGGFSPLIGLFGLVGAWLILVRVLGEGLFLPADLIPHAPRR